VTVQRRRDRQRQQAREARRLHAVQDDVLAALGDLRAHAVAEQAVEPLEAIQRGAHVGGVLHDVADDAQRGQRHALAEPQAEAQGARLGADRLPQREVARDRHAAVGIRERLLRQAGGPLQRVRVEAEAARRVQVPLHQGRQHRPVRRRTVAGARGRDLGVAGHGAHGVGPLSCGRTQ